MCCGCYTRPCLFFVWHDVHFVKWFCRRTQVSQSLSILIFLTSLTHSLLYAFSSSVTSFFLFLFPIPYVSLEWTTWACASVVVCSWQNNLKILQNIEFWVANFCFCFLWFKKMYFGDHLNKRNYERNSNNPYVSAWLQRKYAIKVVCTNR